MILVADGISVRSCRGDKEVQRLSTGIAGALCENIHKAAVRLGMKLIQNQTGYIQTVLGTDFCRKHLIESHIGIIDQTFCGRHDLGAFQERRCHFDHALGDIEYNGCLPTISSSAVDLSRRLVVGVEQIQCNCRCKLTVVRRHK